MTEEEYEKLNTGNSEVISYDDLINKCNRTLVYGYNLDRKTVHVYLKYSKIWVLVDGSEPVELKNNLDAVPEKRAYVECCDYHFCKLLKDRGIWLNFTSPNFLRPVQTFYGDTHWNGSKYG